MDNEEIKDFIERLKKLDEELNDVDEDTVFVDEINSMLNQLNNLNNQNTFELKIKIKKLNVNATIPKYAKDGDAGMDLVAVDVISETNTDITYGTGIALEIPKGYVGLVFPRSSIRKYDLLLSNSVGVIDSGYRGEIQATFKKTNHNKKNETLKYKIGDKIAQIIIIPYPKIEFIETDQLSQSERGDGGFGSSGN